MAVSTLPRVRQNSLSRALIITRREVRDSLRDWRIVMPVIILTLIFPFLMDYTSRWATNWVSRFTDPLLVERLNPFLLMVVGFFPISFSLIIALESFVGEKERNSIEPILATPLSDFELYLGKLLSSLLVPLGASYLGITVFLLMRLLTTPPWIPPLNLTVLMFLLTTAEALVMVSGAVVISSQTTSVRAANLLASFIIIPMALLVQAESIIMFYAEYSSLWWFVAGLLVVNVILIRMGIRLFNREDILAKEMDELNLKNLWRDFKGYFLRPPELAAERDNRAAARFNLRRIYRHDIPHLIRQQTLPLGMVLLATLVAGVLGAYFASLYPIPRDAFPLDRLTAENAGALRELRLPFNVSTRFIFFNNLRAVIMSMLAALISFGSLTLLITILNMGFVSFVVTEVIQLGYNPLLFISTFILPHGILELPAVLLSFTFALRIGAAMVSPPDGFDLTQGVLLTLANFIKVLLFLIIPMLLVAAYIEANITPQIVLAVYAR